MDTGMLAVTLAVVAFIGPLVVYFESVNQIVNVLVWPIRVLICALLFLFDQLTDLLIFVDEKLDNPLVKLVFLALTWLLFPSAILKFWLTVPLLILVGMIGVMISERMEPRPLREGFTSACRSLNDATNATTWPIHATILTLLFVFQKINRMLMFADQTMDRPLAKLVVIAFMLMAFPGAVAKFWLSVPIFLMMAMIGIKIKSIFLPSRLMKFN